jgi:hypothetical protein
MESLFPGLRQLLLLAMYWGSDKLRPLLFTSRAAAVVEWVLTVKAAAQVDLEVVRQAQESKLLEMPELQIQVVVVVDRVLTTLINQDQQQQ